MPDKNPGVELGFTMLFGYSPAMEEIIALILKDQRDIAGGVSYCNLKNGRFVRETFKAIILVSGNPFFGEDEFLDRLGRFLKERPFGVNMAFFETTGASSTLRNRQPGKTGDQRFFEMEFEETRRQASPEISFPVFHHWACLAMIKLV